MAKEKRSAAEPDVAAGKSSPRRSAADLDAELAALEAELAALEGKPKKKVEKPAKKEAPAPARDAAPSPAPEPEPTKEKKGRFSLPKVPKLGKKKADEPAPAAAAPSAAAEPERAPLAAPTPPASSSSSSPPASEDTSVNEIALAPQRAFEPEPAYDLSLWRQEGDAWIRVVPETPLPVMRRVLDESGNVVREESAEKRDVESVSSVRAERGIGRLLRRKG